MNIDISFSSALARSGFQHRSTSTADGNVIYRLSDGSGHVKVPLSDWTAIGDIFEKETKTIRRRATQAVLLVVPATLIIGFTIAQVVPGGGLLIVMTFFGSPIVIYLRQAGKVQKVSATIESTLCRYPRTAAAPPSPQRPPRWLDILCILLCGPWLILALIGEIGGPETYRNTPLKGMHLNWEAWIAIGALALRLAWPRVVGRLGRRFA